MKDLLKTKKLSKILLYVFIGSFALEVLLYFTIAQEIGIYDTFLGFTFRMFFCIMGIALVLFVVIKIAEYFVVQKSDST